MSITNEVWRDIMLFAWNLRRTYPERDFADCLRGAWRFVRGMAKACKALMRQARGGARVAFSRSLIQSPIGRATATVRHPSRAAWHAARMTARLGT